MRSSIPGMIAAVVLVASASLVHADTQPTFSKDVAPILYKNCVSCHRPGEMGPMSLLTYSDARPWARSIRERVTARSMPPWFADPHYGKFSNDPSLAQSDVDTIVAWVNAGAPQGAPKDMPKVPENMV